MNEELRTALTNLVNSSIQVKDFVATEAPEVIQQLLTWKFTVSIISLVIFFIIWSAIVYVNKWYFANGGRAWIEDKTDDTISVMSMFIFNIIVPIISLILFSIDWLKIWVAPKIFLIEYAAEMLK